MRAVWTKETRRRGDHRCRIRCLARKCWSRLLRRCVIKNCRWWTICDESDHENPTRLGDCATPNRVDMEQVMNHLVCHHRSGKATVLT
ncbi:hypothetical protein KCP73_16370 [Salmonella enterica subsp. enterica]|nr:hypothetical protein KCP73_16370 [Salmonella enterica subsp. enterica]